MESAKIVISLSDDIVDESAYETALLDIIGENELESLDIVTMS